MYRDCLEIWRGKVEFFILPLEKSPHFSYNIDKANSLWKEGVQNGFWNLIGGLVWDERVAL